MTHHTPPPNAGEEGLNVEIAKAIACRDALAVLKEAEGAGE